MQGSRNKYWAFALRAITTLCYAILALPLLYGLWLTVRCFGMDYFSIPSHSMEPTLYPGDKVVVNKLIMGARIYTDLHFNLEGVELKCFRTKGFRRIRHNDMVVFNFPFHDGKIKFVINNVFCKRVVALPGDSIWTVGGYYRNNNYQGVLGIESSQRKFAQMPDTLFTKEAFAALPYDMEHAPSTIKNMHAVYVPHKGDVVRLTPFEAAYYRMILEWETGKKITWDWQTQSVFADGKRLFRHTFAHDYYFMAGDNVADSNDSRYWGLVPEEYIVGVVGYVYHGKE